MSCVGDELEPETVNDSHVYMTNKRRQEEKVKIKEDKILRIDEAMKNYYQGKFKSITSAATHYDVPVTTLRTKIITGEKFTGSGRKSPAFSADEEQKIVEFLKDVARRGCGFTFAQLSLLIQELMISVVSTNPARKGVWVENGYYPNKPWVSRFIKRHQLKLRSTMELSKARAILTPVDLEAWFSDFMGGLVNNPKFSSCFTDARRIFNQDETAISVGYSKTKVLAEVGTTDVLYSIGGSSREHVTCSVIAAASGECAGVRLVYKGQRNMAQKYLADLPKGGLTGTWRFSTSEKGYMTRVLFLHVLSDLDEWLTSNNIPRPVVLVMDGFSGHLGLEVAEFCESRDIQLWLLRPNTTHLLQPLDLAFFSPLKSRMKSRSQIWQGQNPDKVLTKYSVMTHVAYPAMEEVFSKPETLIGGFKRAGIFPPDPQAPDRNKLQPGLNYDQSPESNNNPVLPSLIQTGSVGDDVVEEVEDSFSSLNIQLSTLGLALKQIEGDGNCLFRALGDQLHGSSNDHFLYRTEVVNYMRQNRQDFEAFIEDGQSLDSHLSSLAESGTFAGNESIVAFARLHNVTVVIHQLSLSPLQIHGGEFCFISQSPQSS